MGTEQKEAAALTPVFERLAREFSEPAEEYRVCVQIGGRRVALCFPEQAQAAEVEQCFVSWRIPDVPEFDARMYFWSDDCSRYINQNSSNERRRYREENRWIIVASNRWITGADLPNRAFYYCIHDPEKRPPIPYWRVSSLVSQWAGTAGLLPVHGGSVGIGDSGVLIIAKGGGGKSTLAASCLLSGMDYVADDYVLISAEGPLLAMPLFSTLKMNPDMKRQLELSLPVIWEDASRGGKQLLDASSFSIRRDTTIRAVVFLSGWNREQPEILPAFGHSAIRLIQTALRTEGAYDPLIARSVVQRLSGLPAYEMSLSGNLEQNADALRVWIERMK